jgi:hypothetical protein
MELRPSWEADRSSANQEIPRTYGTRKLITAFTSARHLFLSLARSVPIDTTNYKRGWFNDITQKIAPDQLFMF